MTSLRESKLCALGARRYALQNKLRFYAPHENDPVRTEVRKVFIEQLNKIENEIWKVKSERLLIPEKDSSH